MYVLSVSFAERLSCRQSYLPLPVTHTPRFFWRPVTHTYRENSTCQSNLPSIFADASRVFVRCLAIGKLCTVNKSFQLGYFFNID